MSLRTITLILALAVGAGTAGICLIAGMFDPLEVQPGTEGPFYVVYREYTGPYDGIRVVLTDVHAYLAFKRHLRADRGFALFYDNASSKRADSLRCIGGCLTDSLLAPVDSPYKAMKIEQSPAIVGVFPIRTFLSYATGSLKFSEKLALYCSQNKIAKMGPTLAIYDMSARQIRYYAPIIH